MAEYIQKMETFVSVVLIVGDFESVSIGPYCEKLQIYLEARYSDYEIIIIENNKRKCSKNKREILKNTPSIRWISLAFPVDIDIALSAGIENAIGDFVVLLRPEADPIDVIDGVINEAIQGHDVVVGIAKRDRTLGYKVARRLGNKVLHKIGYHVPKNATPLRCLSRRAINTVLATGQINHQFFVKVANSGYLEKEYFYKLLKREEATKKTLWSGIKQVLNLMIFNSTIPLRWISTLGVIGSFSSFTFAMYSVFVNIVKDNIIEGWTSLILISSFLFMILFVILAFLGEYLARLLSENGNQRSYYVASEETSDVMLEIDRFNVLRQS